MFVHIENKIQGIAYWLCIIGCIGSIGVGIYFVLNHLPGWWVYCFVYPVLIWIGSCLIYGFGILIEQLEYTNCLLEKIEKSTQHTIEKRNVPLESIPIPSMKQAEEIYEQRHNI